MEIRFRCGTQLDIFAKCVDPVTTLKIYMNLKPFQNSDLFFAIGAAFE